MQAYSCNTRVKKYARIFNMDTIHFPKPTQPCRTFSHAYILKKVGREKMGGCVQTLNSTVHFVHKAMTNIFALHFSLQLSRRCCVRGKVSKWDKGKRGTGFLVQVSVAV